MNGILRLGCAALALSGIGATSTFAQPQKPDGRANVIVIYADDLGWGDLGCYGHAKFKTPHIDRMAAEGAKLTNFQSVCPYCAPSRAALLTGRYQFRSGMTRNPAPDAGINDFGIPDRETTLAEAFREAGYRTCCIGKWHLGHKPEFHPLKHGFDEYLGILYSNDMRPVELWDGNQVAEYPVVQVTLTKRYTARALRFIDENKTRSFFLYLPHAMPHKPLAASEKFYKKSGIDLYGDVLAELDWSVGQLLAKLKESGIDERTLVFFSSDNGPWYGGSTGGLRGMKGESFEGGIRVPLIARWPGKIPAGHVNHEPAAILDLYATGLKAAGVPLPAVDVLDSRDILPMLTTSAKSPHELLFCLRDNRLMTVRSGKWKLHVGRVNSPKAWMAGEPWTDPRAPDGVTLLAPYEQYHPSRYPGVMSGDQWDDVALFNLESDPTEQKNVAAQNPDVVERLRKMFDEMNAQIPNAAGTKKANGRKR